MVPDTPNTTIIIKGLFGMIKCGLENRNDIFGINLPLYEYLTYIYSENDENTIVNDLFTMLTTGSIH